MSPAVDGLSCNTDRFPADGVPERSDRVELVRRWQKNERLRSGCNARHVPRGSEGTEGFMVQRGISHQWHRLKKGVGVQDTLGYVGHRVVLAAGVHPERRDDMDVAARGSAFQRFATAIFEDLAEWSIIMRVSRPCEGHAEQEDPATSGKTYDVRDFRPKRGLHSRAQLCELGLEGLGDINSVSARINKGDNIKQRPLRRAYGTGGQRWAPVEVCVGPLGRCVARRCILPFGVRAYCAF